MPASPAAAAAHVSAAPAWRAHSPPSLHRFLAARWAAVDQMTLALVVCVHASVLFRGSLQPRELLTYRVLLVAHAGSLTLLLAAPPTYLRHRSAILSALRLVDLILLPELVDMQRIHQPASAAGAAAAAAAAGQRLQAAAAGSCRSSSISATSLAFSLRGMSADGASAALRAWWLQAQGSLQAALVLMVAITRMHACLAAASGAQLPPALHLLVHGTTVGVLCLRSPAACRRYVGAASPHNGQLVEGLFWVLRQMTSTLAVGSGLALGAASDTMSTSQKCVAVTWSLEISVGLVLLTLAVWRVQLGAAQKYVEGAQRGPHREAAEQEVACSEYARLCAPTLEAANSTGWALAAVLAALFGFLGGLLYAQSVA